jgi:hypothetical protein
MDLICLTNGRVQAIYSEVIDINTLGRPSITRASHVEPDSQGQWWIDLSPVDGPKLGPFCRRSDALSAETTWLLVRWLGCASAR